MKLTQHTTAHAMAGNGELSKVFSRVEASSHALSVQAEPPGSKKEDPERLFEFSGPGNHRDRPSQIQGEYASRRGASRSIAPWNG